MLKPLFLLALYAQQLLLPFAASEGTPTDNVDIYQYLQELRQQYEERMLQYENRLVESEDIVSTLKSTVNVQEKRIAKLEDENSILKDRFAEYGVGFTAVIYAGGAYNAGDTIIFEAEMYDGNNNYDPSTGTYTCPTSGMYLFSTELYGIADNGSGYCIYVGSTEKSCGYAAGNRDGAASLVTECSAGTQVTVKAFRDNTRTHSDQDGRPISSFSGILIALGSQ